MSFPLNHLERKLCLTEKIKQKSLTWESHWEKSLNQIMCKVGQYIPGKPWPQAEHTVDFYIPWVFFIFKAHNWTKKGFDFSLFNSLTGRTTYKRLTHWCHVSLPQSVKTLQILTPQIDSNWQRPLTQLGSCTEEILPSLTMLFPWPGS